jgi:hypothetical protein
MCVKILFFLTFFLFSGCYQRTGSIFYNDTSCKKILKPTLSCKNICAEKRKKDSKNNYY